MNGDPIDPVDPVDPVPPADPGAPVDPGDLIALGAAGALTDNEYAELDALLATDPDLAREYTELQIVAATLAEITAETPPASLRASILDAIAEIERVPTAPKVSEPVGPAAIRAVPEVPRQPEPTTNVVPIRHRRWMVPATAAAAAVVLLVGGLLINRSADAPGDDRIAAVLDDDDAVTIPMAGDMGELRLVASESEAVGVLTGDEVARPDEGRVFQLWLVGDGDPVSMGTFVPLASGEVEMLVESADPDADYAITEEPEGGSPQPTSDMLAVSPGLA